MGDRAATATPAGARPRRAGARVEAFHAVEHRVPRGEDEHRRRITGVPHGREDLEPVQAGQHQVEDHQVEASGVRGDEALLTGCRERHRVAFGLQAVLHGPRHLRFIFDHQDANHSGLVVPQGRLSRY